VTKANVTLKYGIQPKTEILLLKNVKYRKTEKIQKH